MSQNKAITKAQVIAYHIATLGMAFVVFRSHFADIVVS